MIPVDGNFILAIVPRFSGSRKQKQEQIIGAISAIFSSTLNHYAINTRLRIAHFMGQVTHECDGFVTTEEYASGAAYEGRHDLGNTQRGDGKRYKGRGLIQLTGRANYRKIGPLLDLPLEEAPELAAEPVNSLKIACEYWKTRNINAKAEQDDLFAVTRLVNGGLNGLEDRRQYLIKAKSELAKIEGLIIAANEGGHTTILHRGSFGAGVAELQKLLNKAGFALSIDGDFGAATELAIMTFQKNHSLAVDGIVGKNTWAKLRS